MKSAIEWISVAKGIGIFLVVVGHFHPEGSPAYWTHINRIIYQFHMPLFFLLSGYLYVHGKYAYWEMLASKVKRLGYPFVSIAAIFFLIKWMAGNWFSLQHAITVDSLIVLLTNPAQSYMPLLWFVHALFLMFILYPLLRLKLGNWVIMICFLGINVFWGSDFPVIGRMVAYMPFFVAGVMLREQTLPMQ
jgi:fucose 4-O-acetylase-like acetyltransferase